VTQSLVTIVTRILIRYQKPFDTDTDTDTKTSHFGIKIIDTETETFEGFGINWYQKFRFQYQRFQSSCSINTGHRTQAILRKS